jgi:hypothetical protein
MHARMLVDSGPIPGIPKGPLHSRIRRMPACQPPAFTPGTQYHRREDELPGKRSRSRGIFAGERAGKWGQSGAMRRVLLVLLRHPEQLLLERCMQPFRQQRGAILSAFPGTDVQSPPEKSMSLTRSVMHSLTRKPEPYISSAISLVVPVICSRMAFTSSRDRTTGIR